MIDGARPSRYATAAGRWAGVGPYYAMFPVDFANSAVREYSKLGECVFDPFAGRATSLFAAASQGRVGLGIEINPVGWVYGKAKLQTATREEVEERFRWLGTKANYYRGAAEELPRFFHCCFCVDVQAFLIAARELLDWRRSKTDWTAMALLMIDLHGKRECALSNQLRQTKAMSPQYAIQWWQEHGLGPPERNPVEFMLKKVNWRFAKGRPSSASGHVYLGNCTSVLKRWQSQSPRMKAALLLTSPPYHSITNYFYDQWLRLWLLGGPPRPLSSGNSCKSKFENRDHYVRFLRRAFALSKEVLKSNAVVCVRTDARQFTREATIEALELAFPRKKLRSEERSSPDFTQTRLFNSVLPTMGEVDLTMW